MKVNNICLLVRCFLPSSFLFSNNSWTYNLYLSNLFLFSGDEIVGATINFDDLKKDEILDILKLIEPYNDKIQVLTKETLKPSKSMGNLDQSIKAPNEVCALFYYYFFVNKGTSLLLILLAIIQISP